MKNSQFHKILNAKLWDGDDIRSDVRLSLLRAAIQFYDFLDIPSLIVLDIVMTGSNAGYNYSTKSDVDVHLLVDPDHLVDRHLSENLFRTKKALWSSTYSPTCKGFPIELYMEITDTSANSNGLFSLLKNEWYRKPKHIVPSIDDTSIDAKYKAWAHRIKEQLREPSSFSISEILGQLRQLRQSGLEDGGEFSVENLVFKKLRDRGYIQKLLNARIEATNSFITVESDVTS